MESPQRFAELPIKKLMSSIHARTKEKTRLRADSHSINWKSTLFLSSHSLQARWDLCQLNIFLQNNRALQYYGLQGNVRGCFECLLFYCCHGSVSAVIKIQSLCYSLKIQKILPVDGCENNFLVVDNEAMGKWRGRVREGCKYRGRWESVYNSFFVLPAPDLL